MPPFNPKLLAAKVLNSPLAAKLRRPDILYNATGGINTGAVDRLVGIPKTRGIKWISGNTPIFQKPGRSLQFTGEVAIPDVANQLMFNVNPWDKRFNAKRAARSLSAREATRGGYGLSARAEKYLVDRGLPVRDNDPWKRRIVPGDRAVFTLTSAPQNNMSNAAGSVSHDPNTSLWDRYVADHRYIKNNAHASREERGNIHKLYNRDIIYANKQKGLTARQAAGSHEIFYRDPTNNRWRIRFNDLPTEASGIVPRTVRGLAPNRRTAYAGSLVDRRLHGLPDNAYHELSHLAADHNTGQFRGAIPDDLSPAHTVGLSAVPTRVDHNFSDIREFLAASRRIKAGMHNMFKASVDTYPQLMRRLGRYGLLDNPELLDKIPISIGDDIKRLTSYMQQVPPEDQQYIMELFKNASAK